MKIVSVNISVPEGALPHLFSGDKKMKLQKGAMMLYPFIKNQTVSYGRVAELLGIRKRDLIDFYSAIGIPYLDQSEDELMSDLETLDGLFKKGV